MFRISIRELLSCEGDFSHSFKEIINNVMNGPSNTAKILRIECIDEIWVHGSSFFRALFTTTLLDLNLSGNIGPLLIVACSNIEWTASNLFDIGMDPLLSRWFGPNKITCSNPSEPALADFFRSFLQRDLEEKSNADEIISHFVQSFYGMKYKDVEWAVSSGQLSVEY